MEKKKLGRPRIRTDEERKAIRKAWMKKNAESVSTYNKEYNQRGKDGLHRVYLLKDHHYIGVTGNLNKRFERHREDFNRNTDNYRIMYTTPDRNKALEIEKQYHGIGFFGANK